MAAIKDVKRKITDLGKASLSDSKAGIEQSGSTAVSESIHPDTAVSGTKKKALRLKFEETQKKKPSQLTHVGIYVGNNMMIHAGDPIGFADLKNAQWAKKIYAFGRLPID